MLICVAPAAKAGEGKAAGVDLTAGFGSRLAAQGLRNLHLGQVCDPIALAADEMNMGVGISVEALHAVDSPQADDLALLLKQRQVPVHRSQRNIREVRLQPGVDPVSGRVDISRLQAVQNGIPLAEMLCSLLHRHLLFENDYYLHSYDSIENPVCQ